MGPKESNNPTLDSLINTHGLLRDLGLVSKDHEKNASIFLSVFENFNSLFKERAWVLNDYLTLECYKKAVDLALDGKLSQAENVLIKGVDEGLSVFIQHLSTAKEFEHRADALKNAKELHLQKNYGASVPLLLIAIDGISNDIANLGLFAQDSNIDVWDSICQYDDAFTYLQKNFLTKSRTITNSDEITVPFRNGILHGRDLNYANIAVSSKCWNTLYVLRTWYRDKKDESSKKAKLNSKKNLSNENKNFISYLQKFEQRESDPLFINDSGVYEVAKTFLESWQKKQWGKIVPLLQHFIGKHSGKASGEVKQTYDKFKLLEFRYENACLDTPCSVVIDSFLTIEYEGEKEEHQINLRVSYTSEDFLPLPINHSDGRWYILQNSLTKILFGRS